MTTPKFTSGPWHYGITSECIINARGEEIADLSGSFITEKEDNARLIASAPALYAALEDVIRDFTVIECTRCDGTGKRLAHPDEACHVCAGAGEIIPQQAWPQFIKNARAVLSLARGEKGETK